MAKLLIPNYIFSTFDKITPEFLKSLGIKALLIDIDNTLAPYEQSDPDQRIINWFANLKEHGISAALVSNNGRERVEHFNRDLKLTAYYNSGKPFAKNLRAAMKTLGSDVSNTAFLGDQLLTDAVAGNNIGLVTFIVPPIKDKNNFFFRTKRAMEVSSIKKYVKLNGGNSKMVCDFWLSKKYKNKK